MQSNWEYCVRHYQYKENDNMGLVYFFSLFLSVLLQHIENGRIYA